MPLDRNRARQYLKNFDFRTLFLQELGWDKYSAEFPVTLASESYALRGIAEKRGVVVFVSDQTPDYATRLKIEKQVAKSHFEHIIVFADKDRGRQVWQWVRRESGRPLRAREHKYDTSQSGELLIQRLENVLVTLEEEEAFTLADVTRGLKAAFDIETVTKKFYDRFKTEHERFLGFIKGIPDHEMEGWYASVMINRLMFLYFIQAKSFLDGNPDYLRAKLAESKSQGSNRYYREFLCTLFFEGFARKPEERPPAVRRLLGDIPYLNGGLFQRHQIEELHGKKIEIADAAFDRLFNFFKEYQWHLDERPGRNDREINPDVLGYIFEKYINQKQMGAYYTKEDITEYISKNTVIPFLFDAAKKKCAVAFEPGGYIWRLCRENPDRHIYEAVRRGHARALPADIAMGVEDVSKRGNWNQATPYEDEPENFLPTETWREFVERRRRYSDLTSALSSGKVSSINDFITLNLDIRQFAEDVIQYSEGPELVRAFYRAISGVSVLDPTCGSGAFLFAALNILKPLYEACLRRMAAFVEEHDAAGAKAGPEKYKDFREILAESAKHPNQDYFVLKSIIVNNLYGVDIMEEAVEICKLRLFLKLVAQVDTVERIEPLPDIDFNIRAGNTLVGYARYEDVQKAVGSKLDFGGAMERIEDKAKILDAAVSMFRLQQTRLNGTVTAADKQQLCKRFNDLAAELDDFLAGEYNRNGPKEILAWKSTHRPFHWFSEFHQIMSVGGFDVVIGNPPWKEYASVKKQYQVNGFITTACGNLHGICSERAVGLVNEGGRMSFIVQLPLTSSSRMATVRSVLRANSSLLTVVPFDDRPGKLFDGLEHCRAVIFTTCKATAKTGRLATTRYHRWPTVCRPYLFPLVLLTEVPDAVIFPGLFPKYPNANVANLFSKMSAMKSKVGLTVTKQPSDHFIFYQEATQYWAKATVGLPFYAKNGRVGAPPHGRYLYFSRAKTANAICAILNSSLFYLYFIAYGDCFHLSDTLATSFPIPPQVVDDKLLVDLNVALMEDLRRNAVRKTIRTKDGDAITYEEFSAGESKAIIDEIDSALARHYGFSEQELDVIINFDAKFRMGAAHQADGEDDES